MDPQAVWGRLLDALEASELEEAADAADDLLEWLSRDGFPPQLLDGRTLPESWCRAVAQTACETTLQMAGRLSPD